MKCLLDGEAYASSSYYRLDPRLIPLNAVASVRQLLWHSDFTYWISAALHAPPVLAAAPVAALLGGIVVVLMAGSGGAALPRRGTLVWMAVVFAALAVPVVLLESMSSVWPLGYRSPMIYQVSAPLLLLIVAGAATNATARVAGARPAITVLTGVMLTGMVLLVDAAFAYNRQLNIQTAEQRSFSAELRRVVDQHPDARFLLVRHHVDPVATGAAMCSATRMPGRSCAGRTSPCASYLSEPRPTLDGPVGGACSSARMRKALATQWSRCPPRCLTPEFSCSTQDFVRPGLRGRFVVQRTAGGLAPDCADRPDLHRWQSLSCDIRFSRGACAGRRLERSGAGCCSRLSHVDGEHARHDGDSHQLRRTCRDHAGGRRLHGGRHPERPHAAGRWCAGCHEPLQALGWRLAAGRATYA